jgi:hypothetical protein
MKTGRIADGAKILLGTIRYYGLFYPARHGLVRRPGVEPAFPSETIRLGDVKAAARTAAAAGEVSWLTSS